ncbi:methyl-CpG-binding domain-containing protein 9-like isoform X2 [Phoenix dactylifera]|uniref:Methyl-CpG-binding domain-containing protein 9-like isoform X2 n=1 Tax=Phoenix dactylifera TaxID=42345 RepID=A0A8B9ABE8_PHODC|nr:methyl-CpG-binding domain-containing protein 9-like isoform X2 [Phoenix dactylifera]
MDPRPAPLAIDLNEFPPPPCDTPPAARAAEAPPDPVLGPPVPPPLLPYDAYALACRFHGNLAPAAGFPAEFPGEAGVGRPLPCGLCRRPETRAGTVVCDGCERGFHLSCARVRGRQHVAFEDWVCTECMLNGVPNKRWALGPARLLDINALPPSEGDGEVNTSEELHIGRNGGLNRINNTDGSSFSGFGASFPHLNDGHIRNAFDLGKDTEMVTDDMRNSSEGVSHHGLFASRDSEDPVSSSSLLGRSAVNNVTVSGQSQGEMFLQSLRNFIMERGGFLSEGWSVDFKESANRSGPYAVYCAPDKKRFESMAGVAQYLGIKSSFSTMDIDERSDGSGTAQKSLTLRRRKKDLARNLMITSYNENQDCVQVSCGMEPSSDTEVLDHECQDVTVGLPIQYEDFFVVRLGKIDLRMTYHDSYEIWPVGYKSYWHDKITGSLFECEVSDGGNAGPVFKVRRRPCFISPIPHGATVLLCKSVNKDDMPQRMESTSTTVDADYDKDDDILMLLSDPDQSQQDLLSCFSSNLGETSYESSVQINMQNPAVLTPDLNCHSERSSEASGMRDEIGEFYVEGRSSQSVWKMVSHTLLDACREVYRQSRCLQFCCRHNSRKFSSYSGNGTLETLDHLGPLVKFCCFHGPINTPRVIQNDSELEATCKSLAEWLNQDRFGLDMGFVQEIIESLPGSLACSHYQFLIDRTDFSTSLTVASGLLLAIQKNGEQGGEEVALYSLYRGHKKPRLQDFAEDNRSSEQQHPPGKPMNSRLPAELVGDVLQGDGGVLCGSLSGVSGMEADALLLAEAERQISGHMKRDNEVLPVDYKDFDAAIVASEPAVVNSNSLPEWAQPLEPVKKLPTNVGTRIRKCIYDSLDKNPPEWAKKILEHSISKEVYKGNASGPTKKAVLSVLAEASAGGLQQKPKGRKEKNPISLSDVIMKKCRIVLRRAVSADEAKVFCNLLGAALTYSNDNEDDGILGFPAMVSRPLDFRAIDLRLAVGAYGGSHEAFLEDVRGVWHNICTAYGDRPDLMQLAETLSQKFESLYEEEVLNLAKKCLDHAGAKHFDSETWKELHDVLLTANELPKAPWEEGVCKVCGIDKDDDSVLLCDKCDSEYHTYCLDPPLARIPEGNWYCPSCVQSQSKMPDSWMHSQFIKRHPRRHLGEEARAFQEALNQLAVTMEEREYWEFSIEERIFLLKFLCDEVLNTALIREHLEQSADKSNDMQQKLRNLGVEWRNLKIKEELLAMSAVKESASKFSGIGDLAREEGITAMCAGHGRLTGQQQNFSNKMNNTAIGSANPLKGASTTMEDCLVENGQGAVSKDYLLKSIMDTNANAKRPQMHTIDGPAMDTSFPEKSSCSMDVSKRDQFNGHDEKSVVSSQGESDEAGREVVTNIVNIEKNAPIPSKADILHGSHQFSDSRRSDLEESAHSLSTCSAVNTLVGELPASNQDRTLEGSHNNIHANVTEPEGSYLEMESLKNEISHLQDSISSLESQVMLTSVRREFLGRDSSGRLYWVIGRPGKRPWFVADGSMPAPSERRDTYLSGSHTCSPFNSDLNNFWALFESDNEIQELVDWLRDGDPRERELKECILQWLRLLLYQDTNHPPDDFQQISKSSVSEKSAAPHCLSTKAAMILESRYGPCLEPEASEIPRKRGGKTKIGYEERMYRCLCLEPIWSSRYHCLSCHQTFCTVVELEGHSDGKCIPTNPASDESKESDDQLKGKGAKSEIIKEKEHSDEVDIVETSNNKKLICWRLVKFPKKVCPYDLDEISKKFIIKNSNKELVQEVGLIGSNGVPSFVPSPVFFLDPTLLLNQNKKSDTGQNAGLALSEEWLPMSTRREGAGATASGDDIRNGTERATKSAQNCVSNGSDDQLIKTKGSSSDYMGDGERTSFVTTKTQGLEVSNRCAIPESSFRPLVGKIAQILKQLKINLLDMDAALPEEAVRPSKSHLMKRCAWRAFIKSSESIFEMIQATILFEGMIKTEYLKNSWWFWSSLTAAAKTPTVSSLALRIYTLDDSIIYDKDVLPNSDATENLKLTNKIGKKRKEVE